PPVGASGTADTRQAPFKRGIPHGWAGSAGIIVVDAINDAETEAIRQRRDHYELASKTAPKEDAIGLALSGGGIRSATFSLGVLVALARRNVLPQIDYLSTVSGGGYLGAFLSTFLQSPAKDSPTKDEK